MIKSIEMKNCATYPVEGVTIDNCQRVNFFYGPNGSGKSTISNFLHNQIAPQYASCKIKWENDTPTDIVVYNRDFRTRHFKEDIAGVFTLGEATIEDIKALDEMKKERDKKQEDYISRTNSLNKKIAEEQMHKDKFRDTVWNVVLKQNETDFQEAFSGFRSNKEKFRDEVMKRYKKSHSSSETRESLQKRSNTLFSKPLLRELIDEITVYETEGVGKNRSQRIMIHYKFIGYIEIPECGSNYKADTRKGVAVEYITKSA